MGSDQANLYVLSRLFQYPDNGWMEEAAELTEGLVQSDPAAQDELQQLRSFLHWADSLAEEERLQHYIRLFDFGKTTTLYLTYGSYGEERERGPALLSLKQIYEEAGFVMTEMELSDYLPLAMEFAAAADPVYAAQALEILLPGMETLHEQLRKADTPYADLAGAAIAAAGRICQSVADSSSLVKIFERTALLAEPAAVPSER
ncbi:nitrate reductase molybdenum cofactor assembly chaperone [Gordoniibacillus kamchatkensis]|uniref:nitrate reductase molybdenum cofactor assembly chaperone n=1 Tax=Gordoniibacillus kamchatkensis TaxID=1590651 RepID=UPI000695E42F|nr:nitrate reductase molybdenum cofactor assembly chaperone [Paenibacillus sp. VKM B-2647]